MARNGSGTYTLPALNPVVTGTVISSTWANNTLSDIATALTNSIAKDGQTNPTANLPMGGFRHTGVSAAVARTDYAVTSQVQDGAYIWCGTAGGTADAITLTPSPAIAAYAAGQVFRFIASGANTGSVTVNISSISVKNITKNGATALAAADIPSQAVIEITYDGTQFQVTKINQGTLSGAAIPLIEASGGTGETSYTNGQILIGNTSSGGLDKSNLTAGTNVSISNGPGSIVINAIISAGSITSTEIADNAIGQSEMANSAIGQAELKTTTGEVSATYAAGPATGSATSDTVAPGGEYGFIPLIRAQYGSATLTSFTASFVGASKVSTSAGPFDSGYVATLRLTASLVGGSSGSYNAFAQQRYVTASPPWEPYRKNDAVPLFVFALIERTTARVISTYIAQDPPWGNNGPTVINPLGQLKRIAKDHINKFSNGFNDKSSARDAELMEFMEFMRDPENADFLKNGMRRKYTQDEKNADMALIPHPFLDYDASKHVVAVINPTDCVFTRGLDARLNWLGDSVAEIVHGDHLIIDYSPMPDIGTPPSVMAVSARWKLTA